MFALSFVLSLSGCSVADAEVQSTVEPDRSVLQRDLLIQATPEQAAQAMALVRADIQALSHQDQAMLAETVAELSVNCSYTRVSYQLPLVLQPRVQALDPAAFDPEAQTDLAHLKRGVQDHVAVMDALEVRLPIPQQGDFLWGHPNLVDRAGLALLSDPIQNSHAQLENIRTDFPPWTQDRVSAGFDLMEKTTGYPSSFSSHTMSWGSALQHLQTGTQDPATQAEIQVLVALIEDYANRGC